MSFDPWREVTYVPDPDNLPIDLDALTDPEDAEEDE